MHMTPISSGTDERRGTRTEMFSSQACRRGDAQLRRLTHAGVTLAHKYR